jgi:hypothetical protein
MHGFWKNRTPFLEIISSFLPTPNEPIAFAMQRMPLLTLPARLVR